MNIVINNLYFFWDFSECFKYAKKLLEEKEVKTVTYSFNNVSLSVFDNTEEKELFKIYKNSVK